MEKIYELYNGDGKMQWLCTKANLHDTLMRPNFAGWTYKELSIAEALVKYGNMALDAEKRHEASHH